MNKGIQYTFTSTIWQHSSPGGWHFIALPNDMASEIRSLLKAQEEGWGRLKAVAKIGNSEWKTAIWFDTKKDTYLLPVKADIRKQEGLVDGSIADVVLWI